MCFSQQNMLPEIFCRQRKRFLIWIWHSRSIWNWVRSELGPITELCICPWQLVLNDKKTSPSPASIANFSYALSFSNYSLVRIENREVVLQHRDWLEIQSSVQTVLCRCLNNVWTNSVSKIKKLKYNLTLYLLWSSL